MQAVVLGHAVELPKLTLALSDKMNVVQAAKPGRACYEAQLSFLREVIGADELADMLDGVTIKDVDLQALQMAYIQVTNAYTQPLIDEQITNMSRVTDELKTITAAMGGRQGFKRVK